ncbi:hypothetical protein BC834DRAFT_529807 [Gloeopeniophorella convolvens]|nr:hypothetical protein BC834DRAFT_529807 [Gloeopeniophorella convolvens]
MQRSPSTPDQLSHVAHNPIPAPGETPNGIPSGQARSSETISYLLKEPINVEELAQRQVMYHKVWETAFDIMQADPTRTRRVTATLHQSHMFKNTQSAEDVVSRTEFQAYLDYIDSELNGKEPPYTFEEHVFRAHLACSAVRGQIYGRVARLLHEHRVAIGKIVVNNGSSNPAPEDKPSSQASPSPRRQWTPITSEVATEWLSNPTHISPTTPPRSPKTAKTNPSPAHGG